MLEAVILDNVEKLTATVVPTISSIQTSFPVLGADAANTGFEFIKNYLGLDASTLVHPGMARTRHPQWLPVTGAFAIFNTASPSGWMVGFYNPTTDTLVSEDTVRALDCIMEDNSGVVWAISNKAGYYGLWKRTGVATWTQVLTDTAATSYLQRWTNGTVYHRSSGGNWYSITSGIATLTSNPGFPAELTSGYAWGTTYGMAYPGYCVGLGQGTPMNLNDSLAFDTASYANDRFWIWTWPAKTRVMRKSQTMWALQAKYLNTNVNGVLASYHPVANSNYWVCVFCAKYATATDSRLHIEVSLVNFGNATEQYLGGWDNPVTGVTTNLTASSTAYAMAASTNPAHVPMMWYLSGGVLRCYSLGKFNSDVSSFAVCRQDIAARITI